jgi:hypothetical protein
VTLAALGLAFLAATLDGSADSAHSDYDSATLAVFVAIAAALGVAVAIGGRSGRRAGVLFGASAGLLSAASDTSIKALSGDLGEASWAAMVFDPLAAVIAIASFAGLLKNPHELQRTGDSRTKARNEQIRYPRGGMGPGKVDQSRATASPGRKYSHAVLPRPWRASWRSCSPPPARPRRI